MIEFRKVLVKKDNDWIQVKMKELQIGDKFKMFEPDRDKEPVSDPDGCAEWTVRSEPEELKGGNWMVDVEVEKKINND